MLEAHLQDFNKKGEIFDTENYGFMHWKDFLSFLIVIHLNN